MARLTNTNNNTSLIQTFESLALQDSVPQVKSQKKQHSQRLTPEAAQSDARRRVHFDNCDNVFHRAPQHINIPHSDLWYTAQEQERFRSRFTKHATKVAHAKKPGYEAVIRTFQKCQSQLPEESSSASLLDKALISDLRVFLNDRSNIGLERMVAREIFRSKLHRRCMLWDIVAEIQYLEQASSNNVPGRAELLLREASEEISHSSVMFARYMGQAASAATKKKGKKETKKKTGSVASK
jgi:hypothetical protein